MKKITIFLLLLLVPVLVQAAVNVPNPLGEINSVPKLVNNIIRGTLGIVGSLSLFYVFQGGMTWITSQGNAEKVKAGKETITWALFGLVMTFLSYVVVNIIFQLLSSSTA